jgi:phosphoglycerate kinase
MESPFRTIEEIPDGKYERAIVRVDFNVPVKNGEVVDGFRIDETWPTVEFLLKKNLKVILVAHIGDDGGASLLPVAKYLGKYRKVVLAQSIEEVRILRDDGNDLVLLENVRRFPGEKENSGTLAKALSSLADIFVNEGFSVSHREHASVVGVAKFLPSFAGLVFKKEIENLSKAFDAEHPFVLILGGKKAETKTPLVEKFIENADKIIMGGALANDFLKARGYNVGKSIVSEKDLIKKEWLQNQKFILPDSVIVQKGEASSTKKSDELSNEDVIMDVGTSFVDQVKATLQGAKLIVWNGSFGICEKGYDAGTKGVAEAVLSSGAFSIVGGGDTTSALDSFGLLRKFSFASTGGGAMLDFLAKGTLPGIEALKRSV